MKNKNTLRGLALAVVLQLGMLAGSAQTNLYLFSGSETNITLPPGTYIITAYGAPGGGSLDYGPYGGGGAEMSAEFNFSTPTNLTLLVGGGGGTVGDTGGGGGGGSFVVEGSTPLVIAGGGGGYGRPQGENGNVSTNGGGGGGGSGYGGNGGTNGGGGGGGISAAGLADNPDPGGGGGGGGFLGDGGAGIESYGYGAGGGGGFSYADGGGGGYSGISGGGGGYGGGGGGGYSGGNSPGYGGGGGGGGYGGGGGGGFIDQAGGGGGGGSIIDSSAITNLAEVSGIASPDDPINGEIIIVALTPPMILTMKVSGANVILSWPTNYPDRYLQKTVNLGAAGFVRITLQGPPVIVNGQFVVTLPITSDQPGFYRLSSQ